MSEGENNVPELTEEQVDYAAEMIMWFRSAVAKLGGDKEPETCVGQGWLTNPLYHIAPDDALEADWSTTDQTHVAYAKRTGLDDGQVLLFHEWYHDEAHKYPDLVELVNEAMGHKVENEEWPEEERETEDVESRPAGDAGAENE